MFGFYHAGAAENCLRERDPRESNHHGGTKDTEPTCSRTPHQARNAARWTCETCSDCRRLLTCSLAGRFARMLLARYLGFRRAEQEMKTRLMQSCTSISFCIVLAVALSGCGSGKSERGEDSESAAKAEIKALLPEAAGMSAKQFELLTTSGTAPKLKDYEESQPLSLVVLMLRSNQIDESRERLQAEFRYASSTPKPSDIAEAMSVSRGKGYVSVIQPQYIDKVSCAVSGNTASGTVTFTIKNCFKASVLYKAAKVDNKWRVIQFSLPVHHAESKRGDDGKWRASGIGVAPLVTLQLPRVDALPDRLDSPNRFAIYLGHDTDKRGDDLVVAIGSRKSGQKEFPALLKEELEKFVATKKTKKEKVIGVIRADRRASTSEVRRIMTLAMKNGIHQFRLPANVRLDDRQSDLFIPIGEAEFRPRLAAVSEGDVDGQAEEFNSEPLPEIKDLKPAEIDLPVPGGGCAPRQDVSAPPLRLRILSKPDGSLVGMNLENVELGKDFDRLRASLLRLAGDNGKGINVKLDADPELGYEHFMQVVSACLGSRDDKGKWIPLVKDLRLAPPYAVFD